MMRGLIVAGTLPPPSSPHMHACIHALASMHWPNLLLSLLLPFSPFAFHALFMLPFCWLSGRRRLPLRYRRLLFCRASTASTCSALHTTTRSSRSRSNPNTVSSTCVFVFVFVFVLARRGGKPRTSTKTHIHTHTHSLTLTHTHTHTHTGPACQLARCCSRRHRRRGTHCAQRWRELWVATTWSPTSCSSASSLQCTRACLSEASGRGRRESVCACVCVCMCAFAGHLLAITFIVTQRSLSLSLSVLPASLSSFVAFSFAA